MARKKYLDENNEDQDKSQQQKGKGHHGLQSSFQNYNQQQIEGGLLGGGTKNRNKSAHDYHSKNFGDSYDSSVSKQLSDLGLTIREMPGDGNCLFRALSDQIAGTARNHLEYRRAVVQYMKDCRADFEPFVEDDVPFDKYVHRLSQAGTFAGNDAIVAFSRLHNVSVVIHQLNSPAWVIHPSKDAHEHPSGREVHIFYHNGDHYNSVRRIGDDSESPTNIRLHSQATSNSKATFNKSTGKMSPPHSASSRVMKSSSSTANSYSGIEYDTYGGRDEDYWVKDTADVDRLVQEILQQTNYPDPNFVRETLLDYNFDMSATVDFILSLSVMMNQQHCQQQQCNNDEEDKKLNDQLSINATSTSVEQSQPDDGSINLSDKGISILSHTKKIVTDMDEQCEDIGDSEDSGMPDESDESSSTSNSNEVVSSPESNEKIPSSRKEPRLSARQKKEQKKRERKREAEIRRKRTVGGVNESERENTVVISNLGSLDI